MPGTTKSDPAVKTYRPLCKVAGEYKGYRSQKTPLHKMNNKKYNRIKKVIRKQRSRPGQYLIAE
jgi:hypothetical protein